MSTRKRDIPKQIRLSPDEDWLLYAIAERRHCDSSTVIRQLLAEEAERQGILMKHDPRPLTLEVDDPPLQLGRCLTE